MKCYLVSLKLGLGSIILGEFKFLQIQVLSTKNTRVKVELCYLKLSAISN